MKVVSGCDTPSSDHSPVTTNDGPNGKFEESILAPVDALITSSIGSNTTNGPNASDRL